MSILHRPLLAYVIVNLLETMFNTVVLRVLFRFHRLKCNGVTYWYRQIGPSRSITSSTSDNSYNNIDVNDSSKDPILFFHGITTGWSLYYNLISTICKNRSVILIDLGKYICV